ncbi:MAG: Uma2 family endonuclease, partial [Raineya sp.]|nr:Uma2 family endonuclease [Raineya sp.]
METPVKLSVEEYMEREAQSEYKSEYHAGEIVAMAGASRNHNIVVVNLLKKLALCLEDKNCITLPSDMLLKLPVCEKYVYPDIVIVCGEEKYEKYKGIDVLLNPTIIIEVLSISTAHYDSHEKLECYLTLESLQEYWLVDSEKVSVKSYKRQSNND